MPKRTLADKEIKWTHRVRRAANGVYCVYEPGSAEPVDEFPNKTDAVADACARDEKAGIKERACLSCRQSFLSTGPGNRMCGPCRRGASSLDENYRVSM